MKTLLHLMLISFVLAVAGSGAHASGRVSLPNGEFTTSNTDLMVKVLGGSVSVQRTWINGRWYFNPAWADLKFKLDSATAQVEYVDRSGSVYERTGNNGDIYLFDDNQFIRRTGTGWRWYDRGGNFVTYDQDGRISGYGNRNNVGVSFVRNTEQQITEVRDHFNQLALGFTYTGDKLTEVRDRSVPARTVSYEWTGERLTGVTDVLGYTWTYEYDSNDQIKKIIDPETNATEVTYIKSYRVGSVAAPLGISFSGKPGRDFRISRVWKLEDARGDVTTYDYEYDRENRQFSVVETTPAPISRRIERIYDMQGRLLTNINGTDTEYDRRRDGDRIDYIKDERGLVTRTERDTWRNVLKVTHPDGSSQQWAYHPVFSFVTRYTDELGVVATYDYDEQGNLLELTQALGTPVERITSYTYDSFGRVQTRTVKGATPAQDATTTWTYDNHGNVTDILDAENHTVSMRDFDAMGNPSTLINARGKTSTRSYNTAGWLLDMRTPLGFVSSMTYDKLGNRKTSTTPIDGIRTATTTYIYDETYRLLETHDPLGGVSKQVYDEEGRLKRTEDARQVATTMDYDNQGRMTHITDGSGDVIETVYGNLSNALEGLVAARIYPTYREEYRYDERDRVRLTTQVLSPELSYTTHMDYDALGNVISQVDAKGRTTQKRYDALQRLIVDIDADNYETKYTYDSRDNLLTVTDANNNTHIFTYDRLGRKQTEARPMGQTITYTYDPNGNLIERLSPNGAIRKYIFDDDDRLEREEHYPPGETTPSKTNSFTYDQRGLLLSYADGLTAGAYQYDDKGQKTQETITFGTGTPEVFSKTLQRSYEPNGLLKSLTYPDNRVQEYTYNNDNQLLTYKIPGLDAGNDTLTYTYRWNSIHTITMPGGLKRTVTLDSLQRPERIEVKPITGNGPPIMDHRYEYDPVSNINKKTTLDGDYVYGYDNLDRLTSAVPPQSLQVSPSNPDGLPVEGYAYDPVHNRIRSDHQPGPWVYNANNELREWGIADQRRVIDYDANGSTTQELKGEAPVTEDTEYVYDPQDRLVEVKRGGVTVVRYAYDPMGRRIWRSAVSSNDQARWFLFTYEGPLEEFGGDSHALRSYGWLPGGAWQTDAVWQREGEALSVLSNDYLGVTIKSTSAAGSALLSPIADSFGALRGVWKEAAILGLPGQRYEDDLIDNTRRKYNPHTGRYLSSDPVGLLSSINIYAYVEARPITYVDPYGLIACKFGAFISGEGGAQRSGSPYQISSTTKCCLEKRFNESVSDVEVRESSDFPDWHRAQCEKFSNNCIDIAAVTRKEGIYLSGSGADFEADSNLVLHEYYHVLRQWRIGFFEKGRRLTRCGYIKEMITQGYERTWIEVEARAFAAANQRAFDECRSNKCKEPVHEGCIGLAY